MSKNRIPLEPCPFCGGEAEIEKDEIYTMYFVSCSSCHASTSEEFSKWSATINWNMRISKDQQKNVTKKMKDNHHSVSEVFGGMTIGKDVK